MFQIFLNFYIKLKRDQVLLQFLSIYLYITVFNIYWKLQAYSTITFGVIILWPTK